MILSALFLQAEGQQGGSLSFLIMLVVIFAIMWLFMIRPQQKRQKEMNKFRDSLKKDDKVVTVGGIYGKVVSVDGNRVVIEVDKDVRLTVDKGSLVNDISQAQQG